MAKVTNVVAYFITQVSALALTYLLWSPAVGFINEMDGFFKVISSVILIMLLIFGNVIGPILVLTDEKVTDFIRGG